MKSLEYIYGSKTNTINVEEMYKNIINKIDKLLNVKLMLKIESIICLISLLVVGYYLDENDDVLSLIGGLTTILYFLTFTLYTIRIIIYAVFRIKIVCNLNNFDAYSYKHKANILKRFADSGDFWMISKKDCQMDKSRAFVSNDSISRKKIKLLQNELPYYLKIEGIPVCLLKYRKQYYIFLFDALLVIKNREVTIIKYSDLNITCNTILYAEDEGTYREDAQLVYREWKYVNQDGTKDSHAKNNEYLPIYKYANIIIEDKQDFKLELMSTNLKKAYMFCTLFEKELNVEPLDEVLEEVNDEIVIEEKKEHTLVCVRFPNNKRIYDYLADGFDVNIGDYVIVNTNSGRHRLKVLKILKCDENEFLLAKSRYKFIEKVDK